MNDLISVSQETVPDSVRNRYPQLYEGLLMHVLHGAFKTTALEQANIPRQTYDRWQRLYPEWVESVRQRALADAIEIRRQTGERQATARLAAQEQIDDLVLPAAGEMATQLLKIAKEGRDGVKIAAVRELGSMVRDGWAYSRVDEQPRQAEPEARLSYNPNTETVHSLGLSLPPGSEVTITARTPDPVLDLPSLPRDDDSNVVEMGHGTP